MKKYGYPNLTLVKTVKISRMKFWAHPRYGWRVWATVGNLDITNFERSYERKLFLFLIDISKIDIKIMFISWQFIPYVILFNKCVDEESRVNILLYRDLMLVEIRKIDWFEVRFWAARVICSLWRFAYVIGFK